MRRSTDRLYGHDKTGMVLSWAPKMKESVLRISLVCYRGLPEWFVRGIVFLVVGLAFTAGLIFLTARPVLRRIRGGWRTLRSQ